MKRSVLVFMIAMVALATVACARIGTSPKGDELPIEKASMKLVTDVKEGGYQLVATDVLAKWVSENKDMLLIDTMPKDNFAKEHIKGAVNSPFPKTEKELTPADTENVLRVAGANKDKSIVVYCGFTACRRSHLGAKALVDNGYKNVYRYPGGIIGWKENKLPLEAGAGS